MSDYHALRAKYPKWAHRRDHHEKKKRRRRRSRRRSRRRRQRRGGNEQPDVTDLLLLQLLNQIMGVGPHVMHRRLSRKHGENVQQGYGGAVAPDRPAPVRSLYEYRRAAGAHGVPGGVGVGVGAAAAAGHGPRAPMPS